MSVLVGSRWNAGALEYFDTKTGNTIAVFDPEALSLTIPKGATLDASAGKVKLPKGAAKFPDGAVSLPDGGVTFAKAAMFVSSEQTGTGELQNVEHGLGAVPVGVLIVPTDTVADAEVGYTATEGAHDVTNVVVKVTTGKKFKVWAMA